MTYVRIGNGAKMLLVAAACATALVLTWATSGHAARTAACPSVPTTASVGYTTGGSVGTVSAGPTSPQPAHTVKHARKLKHAKRTASGQPGQMPPFITKTAADPACVPTPGSAPATAPTPQP